MMVRWGNRQDLFTNLDRMQSDMDRIWKSIDRPGRALFQPGRGEGLLPPTNLLVSDDAFKVQCILPGYDMDKIDLSITGDTLTLKGEPQSTQPESASYHRQERQLSSFSRSIQLPEAVNAEQARATLANGILEVELPKAEAVKPRQISVQAGK